MAGALGGGGGNNLKVLSPNIIECLDRQYGEVCFYFAQAISGRGVFQYLFEVQTLEETARYCCEKQYDDLRHNLVYQ